jgi:hypothetical protein
LDGCFLEEQDEYTVATLTPGSESFVREWYPKLRDMVYVHQDSDVDEDDD